MQGSHESTVLRAAALLLLCAAAVTVTRPLAARAQGGSKWALVVGVDRYQHEQQIHPLHDAGNDARAVQRALVEAAGFPAGNVFLMTSQSGSPPTSDNVLARLASLQSLVRPGDTFVFYFSGHGVEKGDQRWLLTSNTNPAAPFTLDGTSLEVGKIREIIQSLKAARILELVDACADDPWGAKKGIANARSTAGMARDLTLSASRSGGGLEAAVTILSCREGQRSFEGCQGHGYFTYYLVAGLRGAARRDGVVSVPSLVSYLKRQVPQAVMRGESGQRQDPWVKADGASAFDWVLSGRASTHPPPASAKSPPPQAHEEPASDSPPASVAMVQGLPGMRFSGMNSQGYREFVNEKDGSVGIVIPGGAFQMGDSDQSDNPARSATLPAYWIGKYPVTNAQYRGFVNATGHQSPGDWQQYASQWGDQAPVVEVSWDDAVAYGRWAGLRLPTEEEWEKAARGTDGRMYPWGNEWAASRCCNGTGGPSRSAGRPRPVGSYPSGASPYGCLDMAGNVWQWTASRFGAYDWRVLRGGSWSSSDPEYCRAAYRSGIQPDDCGNDDVGLRLARSL